MKTRAIVAADVRRRTVVAGFVRAIRLLKSAATPFQCILTILGLGCFHLAAAAAQFDAPIAPADPVAAGRELVARLLALRPAESATNEAVLRVRVNKTNQFEVPLRIVVSVKETSWSTTYSANLAGVGKTNDQHVELEILRVTRIIGQPNQYVRTVVNQSLQRGYANGRLVGISVGPNVQDADMINGEQAFVPFAGSDFWVADLGMEFLHWPTQRLLKKELCRGQSCDKLESLAPAGQTNGYVRVVSWFDIDTGGPVLVEAYDAKGRMMKEFKPNDFTKVNGQWQVEELEMNNLRTGSRSLLHFKLEGR